MSQIIPFDSENWEINALESRFEDYLGQKSLFLKGGIAAVKDPEFIDGIIEYDIAFGPERGFLGAVWRLQDQDNYEKFYMRPQNSGKPDANQYTPIYNDIAAWQLYHGKGFGCPLAYPFDEWIHVKIIVSGKNGEVYIQNMDEPTMIFKELKREIQPGKVGLISEGNLAPAHFANFSYTKLSNPPLKGKPPTPEAPLPGIITPWLVSEAFKGSILKEKIALTEQDKQISTWRKFDCESSGVANLAQLQGVKDGKNCVFVKTAIISEKEQIKPLKFGFTGKIQLYFNDQLIYCGNNAFLSRDYRFLGTIGYFDELYLPLKKGKNELWIAVSFINASWGVQARFEDLEGIKVEG